MTTRDNDTGAARPVLVARILALAYAVATYLFFLAIFVCAIAFVADIPIVKGINSGATGSVAAAVIIDLVLLGAFAIQHSVMARRGFKAWWTRFVPRPVERTTYVLAATSLLALVIWQWRPLTGTVWTVDGAAWRATLDVLFWSGWAILLLSTWLIDHFELFGLRQVWAYASGRRFTPPSFKTPLFYRLVRHPLYLGFIMAFWATPHMTYGRLLFAGAATGYIFIGILLEERDLLHYFGDSYRAYKRSVPMILPLVGGRRTE